jgi:CBS-domain-containing membrane protein
MPYNIEYEFKIPKYIIEDIFDEHNAENLHGNEDIMIKRLILDYILNKYSDLFDIDDKKYEEIIKNMKIEDKGNKYVYVYIYVD